ncbi:hypothetical protein SARC_04764 [Sphaeroforma arctica JP610]|uniref:FHA domain-containing protein n=1 Tax=Sphaeroforma arctica JP610 TaxID=667725 RepID=A0A0L0G2B6_9EUKA|nr:hypothetical protein SARC_04764 [Sphaeroforma arctica JP610]KNC82971.1 hypothetical protein SARC_04764 [Sphaeroforma arctica JP610]|eukprot:XP_014156873.1 hypothetical protein SARC_04764 [Sphaeroforma arctica JP610]
MDDKSFTIPATPVQRKAAPPADSAVGTSVKDHTITQSAQSDTNTIPHTLSTPLPARLPRQLSANSLARKDTPFPTDLLDKLKSGGGRGFEAMGSTSGSHVVDRSSNTGKHVPSMGLLSDTPQKAQRETEIQGHEPSQGVEGTPKEGARHINSAQVDPGADAHASTCGGVEVGKRRFDDVGLEHDPQQTPMAKKSSMGRRDTPAPWKLLQQKMGANSVMESGKGEGLGKGVSGSTSMPSTPASAADADVQQAAKAMVKGFTAPKPVNRTGLNSGTAGASVNAAPLTTAFGLDGNTSTPKAHASTPRPKPTHSNTPSDFPTDTQMIQAKTAEGFAVPAHTPQASSTDVPAYTPVMGSSMNTDSFVHTKKGNLDGDAFTAPQPVQIASASASTDAGLEKSKASDDASFAVPTPVSSSGGAKSWTDSTGFALPLPMASNKPNTPTATPAHTTPGSTNAAGTPSLSQTTPTPTIISAPTPHNTPAQGPTNTHTKTGTSQQTPLDGFAVPALPVGKLKAKTSPASTSAGASNVENQGAVGDKKSEGGFAVPALPVRKAVDTHKDAPPPEKTVQATPTPAPSQSAGNAQKPFPFPFDYNLPSWGENVPNIPYRIEVLKSGVIVQSDNISDEPFYVVGRDARNHFPMEHPSISRFHAILQHRAENDGVYLYDLGSTHGTKLNKNPIRPRAFHRVRIGHTIQFGASSRLFMLAGPSEIAQQQEEMTEELRQQRIAEQKEMLQQKLKKERKEAEACEGISWGQAEDAEEDDDADQADMMLRDGVLAKQRFDADQAPASSSDKERRWEKDPKKTLTNFFVNESLDYTPDITMLPKNKGFLVKIELPIESASGDLVVVEGQCGRKRDAERLACYNACQMLSAHGLFSSSRKTTATAIKRRNYSDDDYYSSDDDEFLDRTGDVKKRRNNRMKRLAPDKRAAGDKDVKPEVETFDTLKEKLTKIYQRRKVCTRLLRENKEVKQNKQPAEDLDLDEYMNTVTEPATVLDRKKIGMELKQGMTEEKHYLRLLKVVNPRYNPETLKYIQSP